MGMTLPQHDRARWASIARRTHNLGTGASRSVQNAIDNSVLVNPLDAAEARLDELETTATAANDRALEGGPDDAISVHINDGSAERRALGCPASDHATPGDDRA